MLLSPLLKVFFLIVLRFVRLTSRMSFSQNLLEEEVLIDYIVVMEDLNSPSEIRA